MKKLLFPKLMCTENIESAELINCAGCMNRILENEVKKKQVVSLFDRMWHKDHIQCVYCKLFISDGRFFRSTVNSLKPSCYACHIQTTHPACVACCLPVIERGLVAFDRLFHIDCLRCATCNKAIPQRKGFYERDLQLFDDVCYMIYSRDEPDNEN